MLLKGTLRDEVSKGKWLETIQLEISAARAYLDATDYLAVRAFETGELMYEDAKTKRAEAREKITKLRAALND
jgi:hypothetical protein